MPTTRHFSRFVNARDVASGRTTPTLLRSTEIPDGGICLSAFLVITSRENPSKVLMGHLNPAAPWDHIGALDERRTVVHKNGWMLPSSHLLVHESPLGGARRILKEQLGIPELELAEPKVVSEVYDLKRFGDVPGHWDLEFIFRGVLPEGALPRHEAWTELAFVDMDTVKRSEIARAHDEVIESAGLKVKAVT